MIILSKYAEWYLEITDDDNSEKISLHLARHLPQRLTISSVIIVANRPTVFLPVLKKRWATILKEFDRQYASTLDKKKKYSLAYKREQLQGYTFTINPDNFYHADVCVTDHFNELLPQTTTLYIAKQLPSSTLLHYLTRLQPRGLAAFYNTWCEEYKQLLT